MTKIEINLQDKLKASEISVIVEEDRTGVKKQLEKTFRKYLNKAYRPLKIPICCEYCNYVGEAQYHCHNEDSKKNHINVLPWNVCSKWAPNQGLLIYLHKRYFEQLLEKSKEERNDKNRNK